jgi:regulator of extracellular matrix RemA (YlzA/DUF370 family)
MQTLSVGYENIISAVRVVAVVNPNSAPVKRMVKEAKEKNQAIDATCGKPTRSVIVMDSGYIVLSSLSPKKIGLRMEGSGMNAGGNGHGNGNGNVRETGGEK